MAIKDIADVTVVFEVEEGDKLFPIRVRKLNKKEFKQLKKYSKATAKKNKPFDDAAMKYRQEKKKLETLEGQMIDLDALIAAEGGIEFIKERMALRKGIIEQEEAAAEAERKLNEFKDTLEDMGDEISKKAFEMRVIDGEDLKTYILEKGFGFDVILDEINRLVEEADEKK